MKDPERMTKHELVEELYKLSTVVNVLVEELRVIIYVCDSANRSSYAQVRDAIIGVPDIAKQALTRYKQMKEGE